MRSIYEFRKDDAERFASEQGIKASIRGNELRFSKCPYCRQRTNDKDTFAINLTTGQFKCLRASCGAHGNMITLARDFNFSLGRDVDEYYSRKRRYRDLTRYPRPSAKPAAVKYLESRGISQAVTERFGISTHKDDDHILIFPFYDENGDMQFIKYRKTNFDKSKDKNKEWCEANCKPILFGMDQCDPEASDTLILTEGQIDSLSVAEAGIPNAVSVPTGAKGFTWVPYCWDFLGKFKTLIVFGDHENDHITLLDEMKTRFVGTVKHVRPEDYRDCKDANELLTKHGKQAVIDAVRNAVIVENPKIKKLADVERKSISQMECIDTGFQELNRMLGGFYLGHLVILTGERGLGKSTLGSQLGTMAISQGYTTFYYSGELMDWLFQDWFDRQCAGPNHINGLVSNLGYTDYVVNGQYVDSIHRWYDDKAYIYDNTILQGEETESLEDTIQNAISQYGARVILIDNLMTAMEDDMSADLNRQQTRFVRMLANTAKRLNVLIILIVHPRKSNGTNFRNDDVAGSSNITNLADVVMRYGEPELNENDTDPADRILQVTKNRVNGRVHRNGGIKLWFDEASKRISENKIYTWELGWEGDGFQDADDWDAEIPF